MKILHLTLKKGWFDMIAQGEKKEEYREIKPYWITRLLDIQMPEEMKGENKITHQNIIFDLENNHDWKDVFKSYRANPINFNIIQFRNGYSKNARMMQVECHGITIGCPVYKWFGKPTDGIIFIIHLGNIISKNF